MGIIAVVAEKAAKHFVKVGLADSYVDTLLGGGLGGLAGALDLSISFLSCG